MVNSCKQKKILKRRKTYEAFFCSKSAVEWAGAGAGVRAKAYNQKHPPQSFAQKDCGVLSNLWWEKLNKKEMKQQ